MLLSTCTIQTTQGTIPYLITALFLQMQRWCRYLGSESMLSKVKVRCREGGVEGGGRGRDGMGPVPVPFPIFLRTVSMDSQVSLCVGR